MAASAPHVAASVAASPSIPWLPADASWLSILQTCIPVVIAAMVAWVGWQQLATAKAKLNLDLFKDRLPIYTATRRILEVFSGSTGLVPWEPLNALLELIPGAALLFGDDIRAYMQEIHQMATQYNALNQTAQAGPHYATQEVIQGITDRRQWFAIQRGQIHKKFDPYMSFDKWR